MVKGKPIAGALFLGTALVGGLVWPRVHPVGLSVIALDALPPASAPKVDGQADAPGDDPEAPPTRTEPAMALPTDPVGQRKLQGAADCIKSAWWDEATRVLQGLLDGPDAFVAPPEAGAAGKGTAHWTTLHAEVDRLLGALPGAGRAAYELAHGSHAKTLLERATRQSDPYLLAEVSRRYRHTAAGAEATRRLGVYHLDRGHATLAALCFEKLVGTSQAEKLPPEMLFTAALAFRRGGDERRVEQVWKQLSARAPRGLRIGDKAVSLADLRASLAGGDGAAREVDRALEWLLFRGDAGRAAFSGGGDVAPAARWRRATVHEAATRTWVEEAVRRQEARGRPVLPAFFPVAAGGKVVYRSYRGVHAVDARTGAPLWESECLGALDTLGLELSCFPYLEAWVNAHLQHDPQVLFGNPVVGTLSTDGERVYAVDDVAVPPYQNTYLYRGRPVSAVEYAFGPELTQAVRHSRLAAIDLKSGKLVWERGGPGTGKKKDDLYPSYFLGPPLPVEAKLYGVIEKEQELRLVCLDPAGGEVLWTLPLGVAPARLLQDPARRVQAIHLAYADGVLVCPTHAGFLLGVDPVGRSFLWAYSYREAVPDTEIDLPGGRGGRGRATPAPLPPPVLQPLWEAADPIVTEGRVVFTAPDGPSVHCLNLRDGTLNWKAPRMTGDLYLAAVGRGRVLVVNKQACRALDLTDGKPRWQTATGQPSGLGVAGGGVYYLPLKAAARNGQPAIDRIDLDTGQVLAEAATGRKEAPGDLVFYEDVVLSQTVTGIVGYARSDPGGSRK